MAVASICSGTEQYTLTRRQAVCYAVAAVTLIQMTNLAMLVAESCMERRVRTSHDTLTN